MERNMGVYAPAGAMHGIGLGPGSPNTWAEYPALRPELQGALDSIMTPKAFKALHNHSDTFDKLFGLRQMRFAELAIFRIGVHSSPASQTEVDGCTVVSCAGSIVETLRAEADRSVYRVAFMQSRDLMGCNYRTFLRNVREGEGWP